MRFQIRLVRPVAPIFPAEWLRCDFVEPATDWGKGRLQSLDAGLLTGLKELKAVPDGRALQGKACLCSESFQQCRDHERSRAFGAGSLFRGSRQRGFWLRR